MTRLWSIVPLFSLSDFFVGLLVGQTGWGGGALMTFGVTSYGNPQRPAKRV
jgi:hypothetical protein